jgi:hypothetical protein
MVIDVAAGGLSENPVNAKNLDDTMIGRACPSWAFVEPWFRWILTFVAWL